MFVSSVKWCTIQWAVAFRSLMEIKNRSGLNIDHCGTPHETVRESDIYLLLRFSAISLLSMI